MTASAFRASKEALFCIGSNCGDRNGNVAAALVWLRGMLTDFHNSSIYATPDCKGGERRYLNAVCCGKTLLDPSELEARCKEFETACGRDAAARAAGDVPIDVDLVVYDGEVLRRKDYGCEFFIKGHTEIRTACPSCGGD